MLRTAILASSVSESKQERGMAVYDDVERRRCGHCGCERDARSMSCMAGRWICAVCYNAGKRVADAAFGKSK